MNLLFRILRRLRRPVYFKGIKKVDLLIFDDFFPNPVTGFRIAEFTSLMDCFKSLKILINPIAYHYFRLGMPLFRKHLKRFWEENPGFKDKVRSVKKFNNINSYLVYFVFLNNGRQMINVLNKKRLNFVFTLYPGGGFKMEDQSSDDSLRTIMSSPFFKGVFVNQKSTMDYLIRKNFCKRLLIHYIHGIPLQKEKLNFSPDSRLYYPEKKTLDICFVAAKYTEKGEDKGYDLFISVAKRLHEIMANIHFHVIGGFSKEDIDVTPIENFITFYGFIDSSVLPDSLKAMDIILSPNRPGRLGAGSFDGFPLGTCVEASLVGCVIVATDELGANEFYRNNEELVIIKPDEDDIAAKMQFLISNPQRIKKIGIQGMIRTQELNSIKKQILPRIEVLEKAIQQAKLKS